MIEFGWKITQWVTLIRNIVSAYDAQLFYKEWQMMLGYGDSTWAISN